jgi:hypothetical protein
VVGGDIGGRDGDADVLGRLGVFMYDQAPEDFEVGNIEGRGLSPRYFRHLSLSPHAARCRGALRCVLPLFLGKALAALPTVAPDG